VIKAGQKIGQWTILKEAPRISIKRRLWLCQCSCGKKKTKRSDNLSANSSCGHDKFDHGHCRKGKSTPTYEAWRSMIKRCTDPNNASYKRYGEIGVKVCKRWRTSFENFLKDVGEKPPGKSLDRYPNNRGDYKPTNVRWATAQQQADNKTNNHLINFKGQTKTITQWAELIGISDTGLHYRIIKAGWSIGRALNTPNQR
jgi:hypothetical protein